MGRIDYRVKEDRINIIDSYEVSKRDFESILSEIRQECPEHKVWSRSLKSLKREWAVHNLLYSLGLWKRRTKDVSLDYPQKWYAKVGYFVFGSVALLLIK